MAAEKLRLGTEVRKNTWSDYVALPADCDEIMKIRARRLCEEQAKLTMKSLGITIFRVDFIEKVDYMKWHHVKNGAVVSPDEDCDKNPIQCGKKHWRGIEMEEPQTLLIGWKVELEDEDDEKHNNKGATAVGAPDIHVPLVHSVRDPDPGDPVVAADVGGADSTPTEEEIS